jgi:hypothetical protein
MMTIEKSKLPKGRAYAMKTSLSEAAVVGMNAKCDIILHYWTPQSGSSLLEAEYWLPNENRPATLFVRAGSLVLADVSAARDKLNTEVLPSFARWLASVLGLSARSTVLHSKPRFNAEYQAGSVEVTSTPHS